MNIQEQIIQAFYYEVESNHHNLISNDLYNKPPQDVLKLVFESVSKAKERPYSYGNIEFNAPHVAFNLMVKNLPITYMDKLIILASFARCIQFSYELTGVEVNRRLVTFLRVTKIGDDSESYILCPGVPFNKAPHYIKN